jgi:hypothetical protein
MGERGGWVNDDHDDDDDDETLFYLHMRAIPEAMKLSDGTNHVGSSY